MNERWMAVAGWPGYEVSDMGRMRSIDRVIVRRDGTVQTFIGKLLATPINTSGYPVVRLRRESDGRSAMARVHRLVAEAFLPPDASRVEVNHKDGDKRNGAASNLEWVTSRENRRHAWATGLRGREHLPVKYGEDQPAAKLTDDVVLECRRRHAAGASMRGLAREFGVAAKTMRLAVKGLAWRHLQALPAPPVALVPAEET